MTELALYYVALSILTTAALIPVLRRGTQWDVMSAWQRRELMRERHAANPALPKR